MNETQTQFRMKKQQFTNMQDIVRFPNYQSNNAYIRIKGSPDDLQLQQEVSTAPHGTRDKAIKLMTMDDQNLASEKISIADEDNNDLVKEQNQEII